VAPAAVIAALFFEFGKNLLTYYISHLRIVNALAGSLGAAILLLVFVYFASQVILFAAEIAKHRKLVTAGLMPAVDPPAETRRSMSDSVKDGVIRLWKDETTATASPSEHDAGRHAPPSADTTDDGVSARPVPRRDREE
jgi:hypothetical protein